MKLAKRLGFVFLVLTLGLFVVWQDGIQYAMAKILGSSGQPYFDAAAHPAEKSCGGAVPCESGPLKVMTFNVLCRMCDKGKTGYQPWDDRFPHLRDRIKKYDPDLLGLQELGGFADIHAFTEALPVYGFVSYRFGKWTYADCALFYRKDRFDVLDSGQLWLSPKPALPFAKAWRLSMPRYVNWVCLRQKSNGFEFLYVNTHFDNAGVNKEPSAKLFAGVFGPIAEKMPVVVTGDFNTDRTTARYKNLLGPGSGKLNDTYDLAKTKEVINNVPEDKRPPDMDDFINPDRAIDHIFVAGPLKQEVTRWVMDASTYGMDYRRPSDHPSVYAEFNLLLR
jgi:endonuclease/exonuclease/phosphatase family metal-dependent hydrolase